MICIDSDCAIDFLRNKQSAVTTVEKYKSSIVTTEITRFQIFFGIFDKPVINQKEYNAAKELFSSIDVLPFSNNAGEIAAKLLAKLRRDGKIIEEADCFIAAIMQVHGCTNILTSNKKHFERIQGIKVISY